MDMPDHPPPPASPPTPIADKVSSGGSIRTGRRWRSGQWKAVSGVLAMITALAVVWAVLSTFTMRQREANLEAAMRELNDLRERVRSMEPQRIADRTVEEMLEEILSLPDPESL